jgi:tetratricopeptide (TPR) repeat protein
LTEPTWPEAKRRFEEVFAVLDRDGDIERLRAQYAHIEDFGIVPTMVRPLGLFCCHEQLGGDDLFLVVRGCRTPEPILGSRSVLESRLIGLANSGLQFDRYFPQDVAAFEAALRKAPSDMICSRQAENCLGQLLEGSEVHGTCQGIGLGELIWVGHAIRKQQNAFLAHRVASLAVGRSRSSGSFNLEGGVFRDLGLFRRSEDSYRESIALNSSAERNPYGFVGLAATLRRLDELDDAYNAIKKANRHYPEDKYVARTLNAILSDMRADREKGTEADWEPFELAV